MTYKNFEQAAEKLLEIFGLDSHGGQFRAIKDVESVLTGSGYELQRVELVKGMLPSVKGVAGGILENTNHGFTIFRLDSNEKISFPLNDAENSGTDTGFNDFEKGWVLKRKFQAMGQMSPFILRHKKRFADLFFCALIINFFALLFPLFSSFVYDKVLGNGITETLWAIAICLFIVFGIEFCLRIIRINAAERFAIGSETDIDYGIFGRLLDLPLKQVPGIAVFIEKYKQILSYRDFLSSSYLLSIADVPFVVLFLITIAAVGGPMVFIAVLCGCLMTAVNALFISPVLEYDSVSKKSSEKKFRLLTDLLSSREAILGSAFRDHLQKDLQRASVETAISSSKARYWKGFGMTVSNSVSYISYVSVLVAGVYMVESHQMTSGGLLAVSMLTSRAMSGASSLSNLIIRYREFRTALRELDLVLPDVLPKATIVSHGKLNGDLRFENVTAVPGSDENPVLDKISFHVRPGEIVGVAGAPGAGKTTLLRLITGAMKPESGRIYLDDIPLDNLSQDDVSINIGYKPQDLCLLEGSIEDNIRAGRAHLTSEIRRDILNRSGLDFAFKDSVLNWQTEIGPRGARLSGGQKQLVSIARSMLFEPSLLLLDEPTNGLDSTLETQVARNIAALRGKSTVIVSTHSGAILSICDRIIAIGQGRILADGPREKILVQQ